MFNYDLYFRFCLPPKAGLIPLILLFGVYSSITAQSGKLDPNFGINAGKVRTTFTSNSEDTALDVAIQADGRIVAVGNRVENNITNAAIVRYKTNGALDSDFNGTGIVIFPVGINSNSANSVAIQADGKIVVAGYSISVETTKLDFMLLRFNPNGSIDTGFGNAGVVSTDFNNNSNDQVSDIVIQPDGKIIAVGSSGPITSTTEMAFARYNSDGTLDTGFGNGGKIRTQFGFGDDYASEVALQTDGRIVILGNKYVTNAYAMAILRLNSNGTPDSTLDNDGILVFETIRPDILFGLSLIVQSDDSIITAFTYGNSNFNQDFALVKFNPDGTVNTNFGNNGIVITPVGSLNDLVGDAILLPGGKILVGGRSILGTASSNFSFVRYNADGSIDTSFGTNGKLFTKITGFSDTVSEMILQPDNKFVVLGTTSGTPSRDDFALTRHEQNGLLDKEFGRVGLVTESRLGASDEARTVAIQSDGKIIAAGNTINGSTSDVVLIRFNIDGSLDTTFGSNGRVNTFISNEDDSIYAIAIQADDKIVATGFSGNFPDADLLVIRYNRNGSLDTTFSGDGKVILPLSGSADVGEDVLIQPNGQIVVAGYSVISSTSNFTVLRFNQDGSLDTNFDGDGIATATLNGLGGLARSANLQSDGKIILSGNSIGSEQKNFAVVRFNSNGSLDTNFGVNGTTVTKIGNGVNEAYDSVLLPNGKIVVVGSSVTETGQDFTLVRYNSDGTLDQTFDADGVVLTPIESNSTDTAYSVVSQRNGKIIVSGVSITTAASNSNFATVRYNEDGSLDSNFGSNGKVVTDYGNLDESAHSMVLQPNGKIVLAGSINKGEKREFALVRYQNFTNPLFDFDGDGRADISLFRPSDRVWYILNSGGSGVSYNQFGLSTDKIVPADYDGDGKTDIAVWRENPSNPDRANFFILNSSNGTLREEQFGRTGDSPLAVGDWDGDGKADPAVYRAGTNGGQSFFFYKPSTRPTIDFVSAAWGISEDKPVIADYDGDGRVDVGVFRPSNGIWYIARSGGGFAFVQFGAATDKPVVGDYDGDGKADQAVYRPENGTWYINQSSKGFTATQFGVQTDLPVAADYDGDGRTDIAVYRAASGTWYINQSTLGFSAIQFGSSNDKPTPNAFVP